MDAMAEAARGEAERLARLAHEETGFGNVKDKTTKNLFAAVDVHRYIRPLRTVGILREDTATRVVEIAEPMGVVAAVIPSTNPTSTAIYKALISIKARNACVMSPHPSARQCILEAVRVMHGPAVKAGLPEDALVCMTEVSLEGTQELMRSRDTGVILATGGIGLVRAAYSSGRPAYGVGPGNVPAYVHSSADVPAAVAHIVAGKTFDYGTLCSSEQSLVCDEAIYEAVLQELGRNGACLLDDAGAAAVARVVVTPQRLANPEVVGKPATYIAEKAGLKVPPETRVLVARLTGVGRDHPLSIEKLSPVLALYVVKDWHEGERARPPATALRRDRPLHGHPQPRRRRDPGVRAAEAGLPGDRQHPGLDGSDGLHDRPGSLHEPGLRGLRGQHHVGQHHAPPPHQHQEARLSADPGGPGCPRAPGQTGPGARSSGPAPRRFRLRGQRPPGHSRRQDDRRHPQRDRHAVRAGRRCGP